MSLDLNDRQRAMLEEMHVPVWWPRPVPPALASSAPTASTDATPPGAAPVGSPLAPGRIRNTARAGRSGPAVLLPLPAGIAGMDWPQLSAAVARCQACSMCLGRQAPVFAAPPLALRADWLVVADPPDEAEERAGMPFVDDAGKLLDNMLRAVKVQRHQPTPGLAGASGLTPGQTAYLTPVLKCRPALPGVPDAQALLACAQYLKREIALVQPKVILAMGRLAMHLLLGEDHPDGLKLPLGKLRGQVWHYQGVPVVVTYPPGYLLPRGHDKARVWEDLCLALDVVQGTPASS